MTATSFGNAGFNGSVPAGVSPAVTPLPTPLPSPLPSPLLIARDLVRHFSVRAAGRLFAPRMLVKAVDGVSFSLYPGRTLGIVGESGCGKSTTANLAIGATPLTAGSVSFEGEPVGSVQDARWRRQRCRMQMVFQDPLSALDRRIAVGRQIEEPLAIHKIGTPATRREATVEALAAVGLQPHHAERFPHELSGGQRQRAVLARALVLRPRVVVCDEPVSALDVSIQAQVLNLLLDLQDQLGLSYLFISHDLKVVRQVSHEVAVMYLGRIVEQGDPERLFLQPEHPYSRALVAATPSTPRGSVTASGASRALLGGEPPNPVDVPSGCAFRTRCPWSQRLCAEETPPLLPLPDGHRVACHVVSGRIPRPAPPPANLQHERALGVNRH